MNLSRLSLYLPADRRSKTHVVDRHWLRMASSRLWRKLAGQRTSETRKQLENWLKTIELDVDSVLDVGAGNSPARYRVKQCKCKTYRTLDKEGEPDYRWDINRYIRPEELFHSETCPVWDAIFCLEVSEYLLDPFTAFSNLTSWLKEGGKLYISFHFVYPEHPPTGSDMLRFTRNWIEAMFKFFNYKEIQITRRVATSGKELLHQFYQSEQMATMGDETAYDIGYLCKATK